MTIRKNSKTLTKKKTGLSWMKVKQTKGYYIEQKNENQCDKSRFILLFNCQCFNLRF